jgi:hypothetical protein
MASEYFNSISGYTVGIPPVLIVDSNGNVVTNVVTTGNVTAGNVYANNYFYSNGDPLSGPAGGSNTQIQFNNNGTLDGIPNVTWNGNVLAFTDISTLSIGGGTNGYYLRTDGEGNLTWAPAQGGGNSTPAGSNTQVQFNDNGVFGAVSTFTYDKLTDTLTVGNLVGNISPAAFTTSANIIYVGINGSDTNDGAINRPFRTIKAAMLAASSGNISVHVAPGTYIEETPITIPPNVALMGDNLRNVTIIPQNPASDMFYMTHGTYVWGITIRNYTGKGFSYNSLTPNQNVFVSPYIQNITSTGTTGTAVYIDGNNVSNISTKAMIAGFFTIINRGGIGIHIVNSGYSQLVNIYTIACDKGIFVESGAFCTLNGSDCSIGNYGLVADGYGPLQTSGIIESEFQGRFVIDNLSNGQPHVNTIMIIDGDPNYYTIDTILPNQPTVGKSTVIIQQYYNRVAVPGTPVSLFKRSSIIASAHTFEYVGAGTNPATALPQYGGIPIEENEVIATNGGVVTFTSTDQKGNFKVGSGFTINQATGAITGDFFYQSLFAQMTPYILALGGL